MNRQVSWYVSCAAMVYALYMTYQGSTIASNILIGMSWFMFILYLLSYITPGVIPKLREKGHSVNINLAFTYDILMFVGILGLGYWVTAVVYALQMCMEQGIFRQDAEPEVKA